jgi:hypothetical protein
VNLPRTARRTATCAALALALVSRPAPASANVPAAYLPCEGLSDGDACQFSGYGDGACVLDTLCADHVVAGCPACDKCLLCGDPCRGLAPGDGCDLPDGGEGRCKRRAGCTDDERFSFDECNHCLPLANADCRRHEGGVGHWERLSGECPVGGIPDDDLCWQCLPGSGQSVPAESGGCSQRGALRFDLAAGGAWGVILLVAAASTGFRRRRAQRKDLEA